MVAVEWRASRYRSDRFMQPPFIHHSVQIIESAGYLLLFLSVYVGHDVCLITDNTLVIDRLIRIQIRARLRELKSLLLHRHF